MIKKLDLKKGLKEFYSPSPKKPVIIDVPTFTYVMIDGKLAPGEPPGESEEFQQAMMALYGISYTLKFMSKLRAKEPIDYTVMALEALWWVESGAWEKESNEPWRYTVMMMQPKHITAAMFRDAVEQVRRKKGDSPALSRARLEAFTEGRCVQVMHIGPYGDEPATVDRMRAFAEEQGYHFAGKHHEIYMSDPRRTAPEKLKTVLRMPLVDTAKR